MLDHEDLKWIATTSTELNAMLQQIERYSDLARQHKGEYNYIDLLGDRIELASRTARALFDRVNSKIMAGASGSPVDQSGTPSFTVVPPLKSDSSASTKRKCRPAVSKTVGPKMEQSPATASKGGSSFVPAGIKVLNPGGSKELILLVDDEAEIAELASEMLTDEGYKSSSRRTVSKRSEFISKSANRSAWSFSISFCRSWTATRFSTNCAR